MPTERYAIWDCLPLQDPRAEPPPGPALDAARLARAAARTEAFEAASTGAASARQASIEYIRRLGEYRWQASRIGWHPDGRGVMIDGVSALLAIAAFVSCVTIIEHMPGPNSGWIAAATLAGFIALIALRIARSPTRHAPLRSVDRRRCPDCQYDLRGLTPALSLDDTGGIDVGPRACPECGAPWPLVPPRLHPSA